MDTKTLKEINLELLTERQKIAVSMALEGKSQTAIGKMMGTSKQNVSVLIKNAMKRNSHIQPKQVNPRSKKKKNGSSYTSSTKGRYNYSDYKNRDFTFLSPREREMILLKIDGLTHRQIADKLCIQTSCVGVLLQRARAKLDGTYHDGLRLTINKGMRDSRQRNPEKTREIRERAYLKNRANLVANMKDYNKQYYREHKEAILKKQKENRLANKLTSS